MPGWILAGKTPHRVGVEIGSALGGADVVEEQRLVLEKARRQKSQSDFYSRTTDQYARLFCVHSI